MLDVLDTAQREIRAVVLAFKAADREIKRDVNRRTRETMNPEWRALINERAAAAHSQLVGKLLTPGAKITAGNPPRAVAATSTRPIGRTRRLRPATDYALAEFGAANREAKSTYQRRNRKTPGTHKVTRHTMRGLPPRAARGRVVYPAFAQLAPRMVSLWVQTVVRAYHEAAEGRR